MRLPSITILQYVVLSAVHSDEKSSLKLRELLANCDHPMSPPAFYQFMGRMEKAALVTGRYEQKIIESQAIKERKYKATRIGCKLCDNFRKFIATCGDYSESHAIEHSLDQ